MTEVMSIHRTFFDFTISKKKGENSKNRITIFDEKRLIVAVYQ